MSESIVRRPWYFAEQGLIVVSGYKTVKYTGLFGGERERQEPQYQTAWKLLAKCSSVEAGAAEVAKRYRGFAGKSDWRWFNEKGWHQLLAGETVRPALDCGHPPCQCFGGHRTDHVFRVVQRWDEPKSESAPRGDQRVVRLTLRELEQVMDLLARSEENVEPLKRKFRQAYRGSR